MVLTYTYLKPRSTVREWWFRKRLLIEATFGMTMFEPWEKAIVWSILLSILALGLMTTANVAYYLPKYLHNRVNFYVYGNEELVG